MTLIEWIEKSGGPTKTAKLLGTCKATVSQWSRCEALPKDFMKYKIIKVSKGKVSYKEIIHPYAIKNRWGTYV